MSVYPIHDVDLSDALGLLAEYLDADADVLRAYAAADPYPRLGWDGGKGDAPIGSVWSVEGAVLYALARWARPKVALEIGTSAGTSTAHLARAFIDNDQGVGFTSVDNHSILSPGFECGELVPLGLRPLVEFVQGDGLATVTDMRRADFIFDDMIHSAQAVAMIWNRAIEILSPGGLVISHDAAHPLYTEGVLLGIQAALRAHQQAAPLVLRIAPSDTGLAIWRKPEAADVH